VTAHSFLVTAAHVLDENEQTTLYVGGADELIELSGPSKRHDTFDFGFLDISDTPPDQWSRYRFVSTPDVDVDDIPSDHTLYAFLGYPETKNKPLPGRKFRLSTTAFTLVGSTLERYASLQLNPPTHFVGEFDRKRQIDSEGRLATGPNPHGISGGGMWRLGHVDELASGTNSEKLIGVGLEYRKSERILVGVSVSLVVAALRETYPDLANDLPIPSRFRPKSSGLAER